MTLKGKRKKKKNWRKKIEIKRNIRPSWKGAGFRRELLRDPVKSFANPCKFRFFHRIFFISPQSYWCFLAFFFFSFSSRISSLEKPTISPTQLFYISIKYQPWITNISRFELTSTTILNSSLPPLSLPLSPRFDWRALTIGDRAKHNERTISKIGYRFIYIENSFPILILSFVHYFNRKKKREKKEIDPHFDGITNGEKTSENGYVTLLPTVNRASNRPSCDLADAVKLFHDSRTRFFPRLDLRLEATRASRTAAWPLSSIPPGTTFREPIPSWKERKWLSGNKRASLCRLPFWVGIDRRRNKERP